MANIIKNSATKWNRKVRLNVESMLHIGAGKSVVISHQPQYELDTYSLSFFASVNSTFSITKGVFNFTQADLPGLKLGETALITITSSAILKNGIYLGANDKIFNNQDDIILSGDFLIGHLAIFSKEISQQEIEFIHGLGGVMPESTHASCVAHWPFTQRYGKTAYDVVEQYNYAKPAALSWNDNSGGVATQKLVGDGYIEVKFEDLAAGGFRDDYQLGLSTHPDIYFDNGTVAKSIDYGFQFGTNGKLIITTSLYNISFDAEDIFKIERVGATINFYKNGAIMTDSIRTGQTTADLYIKQVLYSAQKLTYPIYLNDGLLAEWETNKASNSNGRLQKSYALTPNHASLVNYTDLEAGIPDPASNTAWLDFYKKTPIDWIGSVDGDGNIIEKGGLPEIKNALTFDGVGNYLRVPDFNPTKEKGYTYLIGISFDNKQYFDAGYRDFVLSKRGVITNFNKLIYGNPNIRLIQIYNSAKATVSINYQSAALEDLNFLFFLERDEEEKTSFLNGTSKNNAPLKTPQPINGFDEIPGDLLIGLDVGFIGSRHLKGSISFYAIWKGVFSEKDVLELTNNTLLKNPSYKLQQDCQLLIDFNQPIDDTAVSGKFKIKDLSPQNHDIFMEGFTANQLNPAHADYAFKPINDLR